MFKHYSSLFVFVITILIFQNSCKKKTVEVNYYTLTVTAPDNVTVSVFSDAQRTVSVSYVDNVSTASSGSTLYLQITPATDVFVSNVQGGIDKGSINSSDNNNANVICQTTLNGDSAITISSDTVTKYTFADNVNHTTVLLSYNGIDTAITLPAMRNAKSVTSIGDGNSSMIPATNIKTHTITIPNTITTIASNAFSGCDFLKNIYMSNSVLSIRNSAFQNCTKLIKATIPNSVAYVGENAFQGCSSLPQINIPNSVTVIGKNAFVNCTNVNDIAIGFGVQIIGSDAFAGCSNLTNFYFLNTIPPDISTGPIFSPEMTFTIFVPQGAIAKYKSWILNSGGTVELKDR